MKSKRRRTFASPVVEQEQYKRFLIVSEGLVTEKEYLEEVRRTLYVLTADIRFVPPGPTSPFEIVERARLLREEAERKDSYDEVWCIFDTETKVQQGSRPRLQEAVDRANTLDIKVAVSNPCIELWILLHEENRGAWIGSDQCQERCERLGLVRNKHLVDSVRLYDNYLEAQRRAVTLKEKHDRDRNLLIADRNPYTTLFELIDRIRDSFSRRF